MIKCGEQAELFGWLSKVVTGTGNFIYNTGQLVNDYLGEDYMRMHFEESESFRELFNLRENVKNLHIKQEKTLNEKKEKLFKVAEECNSLYRIMEDVKETEEPRNLDVVVENPRYIPPYANISQEAQEMAEYHARSLTEIPSEPPPTMRA
jgi:hypothetical protein